MTAIHVRRLAALSLCSACAFLTSAPRAETPAATGDLWQLTSKMSMGGFSMPARQQQVCAAKVWTQPPAGDAERGCTTSDFAFNEAERTATWNSVCRDGMSGRGEIKFEGTDDYAGAIYYTSKDGDVVINLEGHRIGECDNPR